jgi:hypothetical protein
VNRWILVFPYLGFGCSRSLPAGEKINRPGIGVWDSAKWPQKHFKKDFFFFKHSLRGSFFVVAIFVRSFILKSVKLSADWTLRPILSL